MATKSVTITVANRYGMEPVPFEETLKKTVVPKDITREEFAAFLVVCNEYKLNPLTKEIYAFPKRGGGIQPIVSVDGWMNLMNSHPQMDGLEFEDHFDGDKLTAITVRIWRKDRSHPTCVTEYMSECLRSTDVWKQWPRRMLRHKAAIQGARYAFGFAGIMDPDEAERAGVDVRGMQDITPVDDEPPAPTLTMKHENLEGGRKPVVDLSPAAIDAVEPYPDIPEGLRRDAKKAETPTVIEDDENPAPPSEEEAPMPDMKPPEDTPGEDLPEIGDPDKFKAGVISVFKHAPSAEGLQEYWDAEVKPYHLGKFGGDKLDPADWGQIETAYLNEMAGLKG